CHPHASSAIGLIHAAHSFPTRRSSDLPSLRRTPAWRSRGTAVAGGRRGGPTVRPAAPWPAPPATPPRGTARCGRRPGGRRRTPRSEEHTSELQSRGHLVCRLLLENKNR